jgi:hypothetical protein
MVELFHPSRMREGQRDLVAKRPSRSGVGLRARSVSRAHPQPLWLRHACGSPQAGGES